MRTYGNTYHERMWRDEAQRNGKDLKRREDRERHLRETLTEVMKAFDDDTAAQEKILQVIHEQGHDGHLLRRLTNAMN